MATLFGVSLECQYALRATFELALRHRTGSVSTVADLARAQQIPPRYLEQILTRLRTGGYVESRRGKQGGYVLRVAPADLSVGEVVRYVEGDAETAGGRRAPEGSQGTAPSGGVICALWARARQAASSVIDTTTFQDLVEQHHQRLGEVSYEI